MSCPNCHEPLEPNARFCVVCGFLLPMRPGSTARAEGAAGAAERAARPAVERGAGGAASAAKAAAARAGAAAPGAARAPARPKAKPKVDDVYLGQVLNNRFKIESKIGEGGFGAVYRGVQLGTGRKVALKLLHPEMTRDENLVLRFRREGEVLCKLRDAHTITTYDFDQTPDGTLYIAMELLEGKSLHQRFHEDLSLEWRRVFKILIEMCSSLAEAHAQGIVHRDLKPENVYLESRPGNPEFVKILDFGIAKVMRGDTIDPQAPQLTATGQTLGTLEYMSPEQLMGKPLDGRSDVYALGVVAYEMITGQLPFPDAKGPAGLITAQLKQTPRRPSEVRPQAQLSDAADRVIMKCLEKDKHNRFADVSLLAAALQDALSESSERTEPAPRAEPARGGGHGTPRAPAPAPAPAPGPAPGAAASPYPAAAGASHAALVGLSAGEAAAVAPSGAAGAAPGGTLPGPGLVPVGAAPPYAGAHGAGYPAAHGGAYAPRAAPIAGYGGGALPPGDSAYGARPPAMGGAIAHGGAPRSPVPGSLAAPPTPPYPTAVAGPRWADSHSQLAPYPAAPRRRSIAWVWWAVGLLAVGAGAGAVAALLAR
jgi:serine/threonine-protein kinase